MHRNQKKLEHKPVPHKGQLVHGLHHQVNILHALLENTNAGVFIVEAPSGKPLMANHIAKHLLGQGVLSAKKR